MTTLTLPNTSINWIYEGADPGQFEYETGTVLNRAGKQLDGNINSLKSQVESKLTVIDAFNAQVSAVINTSAYNTTTIYNDGIKVVSPTGEVWLALGTVPANTPLAAGAYWRKLTYSLSTTYTTGQTVVDANGNTWAATGTITGVAPPGAGWVLVPDEMNCGTTANQKIKLQIIRCTASTRSAYTPAVSELLHETDTGKVYIGDGTTAGGAQISADLGSNPSLASKSEVQAGGLIAAAGAGSADVITAAFTPALTAIGGTELLLVRATGANASTTPTFSPNGLASRIITKNNNQALVAGDISGAGHWMLLKADNTNSKWMLLNPAVSGGGGGGGTTVVSSDDTLTGFLVATSTSTLTSVGLSAGANPFLVVKSIHVTNVGSADDVVDVTITASGSDIPLANKIPVKLGSSVELLKRNKVFPTGSTLKLKSNTGSSLQIHVSYEATSETTLFSSGNLLTTADITNVHTASGNSSLFSCLLVNTDGVYNRAVDVVITNAADSIQVYLAKSMVVPAGASIELFEKSKYIPSGYKLKAQSAAANTISVHTSGKLI